MAGEQEPTRAAGPWRLARTVSAWVGASARVWAPAARVERGHMCLQDGFDPNSSRQKNSTCETEQNAQTHPANTSVHAPTRALAPMQSSNGLTLTCRPRGGWVSDQDFEALKKDGYGYNSTEFCKLEVAVGSSPTLADALKVGALQVAYEDGKCVVTARVFFPDVNVHAGFAFREHGYTYERRRWTKPMTPAEFQELQALAPKTTDPTEWIKHAVERKITRLQDCCSVGMDEQSSYKQKDDQRVPSLAGAQPAVHCISSNTSL